MREQTLVLIKPDAVERRLIGEIIRRIESRDLTIADMRYLLASQSQVDTHYSHMVERPYYPRILAWMTRSPLVALLIDGDEAITAMRSIIGATDPLQAKPGTIRGDLASWVGANLVHASEDAAGYAAEKPIWFPSTP